MIYYAIEFRIVYKAAQTLYSSHLALNSRAQLLSDTESKKPTSPFLTEEVKRGQKKLNIRFWR